MEHSGGTPSVVTHRVEALVVGSGFGGAVTSCRLALAGFQVVVLERGRRYAPGDLPSLPSAGELLPDSSRWIHAHDRGLWDVVDLGPLRSVQAAGLGGGSLVYANVHLRPDVGFFDVGWPPEFASESARAELERAFDRAAAMLDVAVYPERLARRTPKSLAFDRLGGEACVSPPLAVTFDEPDSKKNAFGLPQTACTGCGACCSGCNVGAKNTLDRNYLALAEQAGAAIHTLTEVVRIEELPASAGARYRVIAEDHLAGGREVHYETSHLFLCAGAVHTTRLLAKSFGARLPAVGKNFFGNGDAIAMIYGTDVPLEPQLGPTITRAIVHRAPASSDREPATWFMIQDGGYTAALHDAFGALRSPLLGGLNRFHEPRGTEFPPLDVEPWGERASPRDPHGAVQASLSTVLLRGVDDRAFLERLVPPWLRGALDRLLGRLREGERSLIGATIDGIPDRFVAAFRAEYDARLRDGRLGSSGGLERLFARLFASTMGWLLGFRTFRAALVETSRLAFESAIGIDETNRGRAASDAIRRALALDSLPPGSTLGPTRTSDERLRDPSRRLMLLAMGDDGGFPRDLAYADERFVATERGSDRIYTLEQRVFRDVASTVGGELRLNPLYSLERETITVHAQGGCGMGATSATSVTDHEGAVHGLAGLHVMDAAAFPRPVGVNPSATIAAIAERNVARFVARASTEAHRTRAEELAREFPFGDAFAARWRARPEKASTLVNLRIPPGLSAKPPSSQPIGLRFEERMSGFVASGAMPMTLDDYESLSGRGRDQAGRLTLELEASIDDLAAFADAPRHLVRLEGTVILVDGSSKRRFELVQGRSQLDLMKPTRNGIGRSMTYSIVADGLTLEGTKVITDDAGFDAWEDTTRLFVTAKVPGEPDRHGIVRLSMEDFLQKMLPSFDVSGTADDARRIAAITTFGSFFFSNLQKVYLPMLPSLLAMPRGAR